MCHTIPVYQDLRLRGWRGNVRITNMSLFAFTGLLGELRNIQTNSVVVGAHARLRDVSPSTRAAFMCASEAPTESIQRQCIETTYKTFYYKTKNTAKRAY